MPKLNLDKDKYYRILKSQGVNAAVTQLHLDKEQWELATFEGQDGYQRDIWDGLQAVRDFSLELWNHSLAHPEPGKATH